MSVTRSLINPIERSDLPASGKVLPGQIHTVAADDSNTLLAMYKSYLQQHLDASQCFWVAAYKGQHGRELWHQEIMDGWKALAISTPFDLEPEFVQQEAKLYFQGVKENGPDAIAAIAFANAGKTRVHSRHDLAEDERDKDDWLTNRFDAQQVGDRLVAVYSVGPNAESYLMIDRSPGVPMYSEKDVGKCYEAIVSFPRVHYWLMLERGLAPPASHPFSPREKEVVRYLLGALDEKSIAQKMGLTKGSLHNYVGEIYKNLGVSTRYQLVQLWLAAID